MVLDSTWFFEKPLDAEELKQSLEHVLLLYPALAGRRAKGGISLNNAGVPFSVQQRSGSAYAILNLPAGPTPGMLTDRHSPRSVASGKSPIMTVRLTLFDDGTSALGVVTSHALLDGFSHCKLVQLWGVWHTTGSFPNTSPYTMDRAVLLPLENSTDQVVIGKSAGKASRLGPIFRFVLRSAGNKPRVRLHISAAELAELKASAPLSGVTTNEVLSARLLQHLAPIAMKKKQVPTGTMGPWAVSLRGKGGLPRNYLGNLLIPLYESTTTTTAAQIDDTSALRMYKSMGDEIRQAGGEVPAAGE